MSLDWNASSTKVQEVIEAAVRDSKEFNSAVNLRDAVVWVTLLTGFPGDEWCITEKNWEEFFRRAYIVERVHSAYRATSTENVYFTPDEIHQCIGLRTNAGNKTRKEFDTEMINALRRRADDQLRRYHGKQEAA